MNKCLDILKTPDKEPEFKFGTEDSLRVFPGNQEASGRNYYGELENIHFPTDHFKLVGTEDTKEEHLEECFRILEMDGELIIRKTPSLGRPQRLIQGLTRIGFTDIYMGDSVFIAKKPIWKRTSILVPGGIGDVFWDLVKLESFCKKKEIGIPEIFVHSANEKKRSIPYIEKFPIVKAGDFLVINNNFQEFKDGYLHDKANLFENVAGCDLFLTFNGSLRMGRELDEVHPEWEADWYPKMFRSIEQIETGKSYRDAYGPYMVGYFIPFGMYREWLVQFPKDQIYESMKSVILETQKKVVLIGAKWDENQLENYFLQRADADGLESSFINLVGKTDITQLLALVENCDLMYGFPSGASFLAPYYKKQTVMLWSNYFGEGFQWNCVVPEARNNWYHALQTYKHDLKAVTDKLLEACHA